LLAPCPGVVGDTSTVFSSSSLLQASTFQLFPLSLSLPSSLPSKLYTPHDRPLLPLTNKLKAIAPPHIVAAFHGTTLQAFQHYVGKCQRG